MITSLEHHITDHCNLNCAGCSHFSPLAMPWVESIEQFQEEWSRVYNKGLIIKRIRLLGGEPLLNPNLDKMLCFLRPLFPNSDINVVTNGILLKSQKERILPVFQENDISITVSQYPTLHLDLRDLLDGFPKIEVYNKAAFWNISLHENPDFDCAFAFDHCFSASIAKCNYLKDGRIYPCPILPNIPYLVNYFSQLKDTELRKLNVEEGGITIADHSVDEIEKFLQTPRQACAYCNVIKATQSKPWKTTEYNIKEWLE